MDKHLYTLIVPTFNRPESLKRLLRYLVAHEVDFPVLVLDSSSPKVRKINRRLITSLDFSCDYIEFQEDVHPFDKFREGIEGVKTPLCGLCADDDIPIIEGIRASFDFLNQHPDYTVAHGYYFQFALDANQLRITNITYYTPDYDMNEPLARLHALLRHYQALTYGTYRTNALLKIFNMVRPVKSILARELLSSALAVVYGKVARLPVMFCGRNLGPSNSYANWHPLEWLISNPDGLFVEYVYYRNLILNETLATLDNGYDQATTRRIIDLIHMQYLARHMPSESFDHIIEESLNKTKPEAIFGSPPVTIGLLKAAGEYTPLPGAKRTGAGDGDRTTSVTTAVGNEEHALQKGTTKSASPQQILGKPAWRKRIYRRTVAMALQLEPHAPWLVSTMRAIKRRLNVSAENDELVLVKPDNTNADPPKLRNQSEQPQPVVCETKTRRYVLAPAFVSPPESFDIQLDERSTDRLILSLDYYR